MHGTVGQNLGLFKGGRAGGEGRVLAIRASRRAAAVRSLRSDGAAACLCGDEHETTQVES